MFEPKEPEEIRGVVRQIVSLSQRMSDFWSECHGWASEDAERILSKSRLDWQVSLARSLGRWLSSPAKDQEAGTQILGYANLGALVEGSLQLFLSVHYQDYVHSGKGLKRWNGEPGRLTLNLLRRFFNDHVWLPDQRAWDLWIERIQQRRNAIHAFRNREKGIGTHSELVEDIKVYLQFIRELNEQLPYP